MRCRPKLLLLLSLLIGAAACSGGSSTEEPAALGTRVAKGDTAMGATRPSALAGSWYPSDPEELRSSIESYLEKAPDLAELAEAPPLAFITPHAGHAWSGEAAAHLYKLLRGAHGISRVILIGPSHQIGFRGASVAPYAAYETPLGTVPVDREAAERLLECPVVRTIEEAHRHEHCLEIQLPFLQVVLEGRFSIVPVIVSHLDRKDWDELARAMAGICDEHTLVIASSDFTHFGPRFGYVPFTTDLDRNLRKLDKGALQPILRLDPDGLWEYKRETDITVCGFHAIGVLLSLLQLPEIEKLYGGHPEPRVLEYYRSGDKLHDFSESVSYAAVAFFPHGKVRDSVPLFPPLLAEGNDDGRPSREEQETSGSTKTMQLNKEEKSFLLSLARRTLERVLSGADPPEVESFPEGVSEEKMRTECGVFVTLNRRDHRLRGCIGSIVGKEALVDGVIRNAINAALRDPRFPPVTREELDDLVIEISVLTPLVEASSYEDIEIGRHGVVLEKGAHSAVFLPQVAPEQGWDRETMLSHLAMKAGLPADAWRQGAKFYLFEALVFSEDDN